MNDNDIFEKYFDDPKIKIRYKSSYPFIRAGLCNIDEFCRRNNIYQLTYGEYRVSYEILGLEDDESN